MVDPDEPEAVPHEVLFDAQEGAGIDGEAVLAPLGRDVGGRSGRRHGDAALVARAQEETADLPRQVGPGVGRDRVGDALGERDQGAVVTAAGAALPATKFDTSGLSDSKSASLALTTPAIATM